MEQLSLVLLLACLVPAISCVVASAENRREMGLLERFKRDSEVECRSSAHSYWDSNENTCKLCFCPAGKQIAAIFCGYGILKGEPTCEPCPTNTTRSGTDVTFNCRPCLKCDPDATVEAVCTQTEDTRCVCNDGMGFIGNACVSCRKHPNASGCHAERGGTTMAPETIEEDPTNPAEEPVCHGKQDHPCWRLKVGFWVFIIIIILIIILCVILCCLKKHGVPCSTCRQSRGDRRNREEGRQSEEIEETEKKVGSQEEIEEREMKLLVGTPESTSTCSSASSPL